MIIIDDFLPPHLTGTIEPVTKGIQWWDGVTRTEAAHDVIAYCRDHFDLKGFCGFEYWYNVTTPEPPYPNWHRDKDEGSEEVILADWACILYLTPHDLWGGFLELQTADITRTEVERVGPRFNRCVVLDPGVWHRVSRVWSGERHAFLINGWMNPPSIAF